MFQNKYPALALEPLFEKYHLTEEERAPILLDLIALRKKHKGTYEHSIRTTLLAVEIAKHLGMNPRELLLASPRHDIGKKEISNKVLNKKGEFTSEDRRVMSEHPTSTAHHVAKTNPHGALIGLKHHRHKEAPYPKRLPSIDSINNLPHPEKRTAHNESKILAIADWFEAAVYRKSNKFGGRKVTLDLIKTEMIKEMPKLRGIIERLFQEGFFAKKMSIAREQSSQACPKRF